MGKPLSPEIVQFLREHRNEYPYTFPTVAAREVGVGVQTVRNYYRRFDDESAQK